MSGLLLAGQFIAMAILPVSLLAMAVFTWRAETKRPLLRKHWIATLLMATVWASSVLRNFLGSGFAESVPYNWAIIGRYAFGLTMLALFLTTARLVSTPTPYKIVTAIISLSLWFIAIRIDITIWQSLTLKFMIFGQSMRLFNLWTGVFVAAWLLPLVAAWLLLQQTRQSLPYSQYRNQLDYWYLMLLLFLIGGGLASVQSLAQPGWQQAGIMLSVFAALIGTTAVSQVLLADLKLASRYLFVRVFGMVLVSGIILVAILLARSSSNAELRDISLLSWMWIAGIFALIVMAVYQTFNALIRRILLPNANQTKGFLNIESLIISSTAGPEQFGAELLSLIQGKLTTDEGWLFRTGAGKNNALRLDPLASMGKTSSKTHIFSKNSPFTRHLEQNHTPLLQIETLTMASFIDMPEDERKVLEKWQQSLYMPFHSGEKLIGLLALGSKYSGGPYNREDIAWLKILADQAGPLLVQSQTLEELRQKNRWVTQQNHALTRNKHEFQARTGLQFKLISLLSPSLRQPFDALKQQLETIEPQSESIKPQLDDFDDQIDVAKEPINKLINLAHHVNRHTELQLKRIQFVDIIQKSIRQLRVMSRARRVEITFEPQVLLPQILGDGQQLQETVRHLLHNAIKFNKIGGGVLLEVGQQDGEIFLHIRDDGVGIKQEQLASLWDGFEPLFTPNGNGRHQGLGLILAHYVVTAHGGRIVAASDYGSGGSTFSIFLPVPG